jgi:hypothetical protein
MHDALRAPCSVAPPPRGGPTLAGTDVVALASEAVLPGCCYGSCGAAGAAAASSCCVDGGRCCPMVDAMARAGGRWALRKI